MNDRILGALKAVGINDSPLASLDHEQQFFALTPTLLLYQAADPASPLKQVTLRDISRIHSDHQGTLRVETSGGTSITASLLGFDPNRVQRFFQTVRDTTARAKQQPTSPLPSVGSKMFSPAPDELSVPPAAASAQPLGMQPAQGPAVAGPIILGKDEPAEPVPESGVPKVIKIGGGTPGQASPQASSAQPTSAPASAPKPSAIRIEATPPVNVSAPSPANATFGKPPEAAKPSAANLEPVKLRASEIRAGQIRASQAGTDHPPARRFSVARCECLSTAAGRSAGEHGPAGPLGPLGGRPALDRAGAGTGAGRGRAGHGVRALAAGQEQPDSGAVDRDHRGRDGCGAAGAGRTAQAGVGARRGGGPAGRRSAQ